MSSDFIPDLVSVVMPTYNRRSRICRGLNSIKAQSYRPIEVVIVDDGSTDDTRTVINEWAAENREDALVIRYFYQANAGASAARNFGLIQSGGEYIQYADSDDVLVGDKLKAQVALAKADELDFVWSQLLVMKEDIYSDLFRELSSADGDLYFENNGEMPDAAYVGIYRRGYCVAIGPWNEQLCCRQDSDYRYRSEILRPSCAHISSIFYVALEHSDARIHDKYTTPEGTEALLRTLDNAHVCARHAGVRLELYGRYFLALRLALGCDRNELIVRSLRGLKRHCPRHFQFWLAALISPLHAALGSRSTLRLLDLYSDIRHNGNSRNVPKKAK